MINQTDRILNIYEGNNIEVLDKIDYKFKLVYTDPPFNTGKTQRKTTIKTASSEEDVAATRKGFKDKLYSVKVVDDMSYGDSFEDLSEFLYPRIEKVYSKLTDDGSVFVHLDYREVHDVKVKVMDTIFGKKCFMNEIIWAYDYGAKSKSRWPAKHDTILWYVKDPDNYIFNYEAIERIPYLAPNLVSKEKAERGKTLTDVWWNTIVCGKEKTNYPTQKPRTIVDRIVRVHSNIDDTLLDIFAGSGTLGESAISLGRNCILIDESPAAIAVMEKRLEGWGANIFRKELNDRPI